MSSGINACPEDFRPTICVICYGDHPRLARRFLESLYRHTDPGWFILRAGLNEVGEATREMFVECKAAFGNIEIFEERKNIFKAPLMRKMFFHPPITTPWVIWFDDDSYLTRGDWLQRLWLAIQRSPDTDQWGRGYALWEKKTEIEAFVKSAEWHRGLPLLRGRDPAGQEAFEFRFATGGFWAIKTEILRALDWPDPRLVQANDDFLLGEALRQNGRILGNFEYGVRINEAPRRNAAAPEITRLPARTPLPGQNRAAP